MRMLFSQRYKLYASNCGHTLGKVPKQKAATWLPPCKRIAAAGSGGAFSSASANNRPSTPAVCSARARVPALGPSPAASTVSAAHTSSGMARRALSSNRAAPCNGQPKRPAAGSASSIPIIIANRVPSPDMARVSSAPCHTAFRCPADQSGCRKRPAYSPICPRPPLPTSACKSSCRYANEAATAATMAPSSSRLITRFMPTSNAASG
ncbi:hypothetical protein PSNVIR_04623 [Pseudomonas sp. Nvir]|nr:hypothetical protein PSNVIR_04623 [Pseudomonas sp. Nvir]